ncbi:MAG: hypothetical protein GOV02_03800 [Candidatus Aenigmarchaeota archaeon]|nr:hypothetical protein [Candidatus Aenigmarchaeota archaeon]
MKIEFELKDKETVSIVGIDEKTNEKKSIGQIFTPGGSGKMHKNAIQICGFEEAFDLWGCAVYGMPKYKNDDLVKHQNGDAVIEQVKDIQLKFNMETKLHHCRQLNNVCLKCYNNPCTCELKIKHTSPYAIKNHQDLYLEEVKK